MENYSEPELFYFQQVLSHLFNYFISLQNSDIGKFLMKRLKLSLRTNYSKMELFYFK